MQKFFRRDIVIASGVFLLALAVRLVFIWQWNATPYGVMPIIDAHVYDLWAQDIANGQILRAKAFYQSPLYPYLLALIYKIFGHSFLAASLFNAILDSLSCAILSLTAFSCFGFEAALLTGALAALDRQLIFYTAPLMKESLGVFLMALFLAAVLRALKSGSTKHFFLSGALLGLLALVRGNALLLAPAIVLLAYIKRGPVARALASAEETKTQFLRNCAAFLLATILFLLPATIHNAIVSHDFVPLNYDGGFNFYMGNSSSATGANANVPEEIAGVMLSAFFNEEAGTTHYAEQVSGRTLQPSEVSAFWRNKALDFIVRNPRQSLTLMLEKLSLFWKGGELPDDYYINFITENFPTLLSLPLPGFWLVSVAAAFALAGFWRSRESEAMATLAILAGVYMLSVLLFYVTDRLRLPVEVFLLPLAGAALPCAWELVRSKRWGKLMAAMAFAVLFLVVGPRSELRENSYDTAHNYGVLGSIYHELGDYQDAMKWLRKGAERGEVFAQCTLATMYHDGQGVPQDYAQAMQFYRQAAKQGSPYAKSNLGAMYYQGEGVPQDYAQAMQWFRKAAEAGYAIAQYNLGIMYRDGQGVPPDHAQAAQWVRTAAEQGFAPAQNSLGLMYGKGDGVPRDPAQAVRWFRKAAEQGNANAQHALDAISRAGGAPQN